MLTICDKQAGLTDWTAQEFRTNGRTAQEFSYKTGTYISNRENTQIVYTPVAGVTVRRNPPAKVKTHAPLLSWC